MKPESIVKPGDATKSRTGQPTGQREQEEKRRTQATPDGISPLTWRIFALAWLFFMFLELYQLWSIPHTFRQMAIAGLATLCFCSLYGWLVWPHPLSFQARARSRSRSVWLPFGLLVALTLFLCLTYGSGWLWDFIFSGVAAGVVLPTRRAGLVVAGLTLLTFGLGRFLLGADWQQFIIPVILVAGVGSGTTGSVRAFRAIRELQLARSELARLAVMEERFRLARDLHDLLGHKLSLITLKSELAGRLMGRAPERATKEVRDIEQVARQMLGEVREAVAGYRQPRLESELENARQVFEAAGISCTTFQSIVELPPPVDAVLAWAVREGVTNVIRHSRAHQCVMRLESTPERVKAELINDGYQERHRERQEDGTGLAGIAERVTIMGGNCEAGPWLTDGAQCFRLRIELPLLKTVGNVKE
ncbi:MAG TPA: histidine kinase [Ktedonobacteraceae bacterium]